MIKRKQAYNKWNYILCEGENDKKFEIIPSIEIPKPKTLGKYYSISKNSIDSFVKYRFYASQPDDFNDLFDTGYDLANHSNFQLQDIINLWGKTEEKKAFLIERWNNNHQVLIDMFKDARYKAVISKFGLICTTPNKLSELMWGYYTNNEGFFLEFDYSKFPNNFHGPFPINYVKRLEKLDVDGEIDHLSFLLQSNIKKDIWKHESEFRFISESNETIYHTRGMYSNEECKQYKKKERYEEYPKESLTAIYLGFNFLKQEDISLENSVYDFRLVSENKYLKFLLLKKIIDEKIPCYSVIQNILNFELTVEKWKFINIKDFEFKINKLYA